MTVVWGIVGIAALVGFFSIAVLLPFAFWGEQQYLRMLRKSVTSENDMPSILVIKPRWRANVEFARYILRRKYKHEPDPRLKSLGSKVHALHMMGYILTILTIALFALILIMAPR